ncbi:DUF3572 domain-containing protein [Jiella sp. M17.18]|uniref:DUF3572 domain-containing protein n=1 Tax=Jiella sp. M17.18 TaxID=3234247 RepID=UPI0034DFB18B
MQRVKDNAGRRDRGHVSAISRDAAASLAVDALTFIANDSVLMERFLSLTGIKVADLRHAATKPGFFVAVLDFLLGHEPTLLAFATGAGIDPANVPAARQVLARPMESRRP